MVRRLIRQIISLFQPKAQTGDTIRLPPPEPPYPDGISTLYEAKQYLERSCSCQFEAVTPGTYLVVNVEGNVMHWSAREIIVVAQTLYVRERTRALGGSVEEG